MKTKIKAVFNKGSRMLSSLFIFSTIILPNKVFADKGFFNDFDVKIPDGPNQNIVSGDSGTTTTGFQGLLEKYQNVVIAAGAFAAVTMVLLLIVNFVKLAKSGDNARERAEAVKAIVMLFIATAGLGVVTLIVSLFYSSLQ